MSTLINLRDTAGKTAVNIIVLYRNLYNFYIQHVWVNLSPKGIVTCDDRNNKMASNKCDIQEDEFLSKVEK